MKFNKKQWDHLDKDFLIYVLLIFLQFSGILWARHKSQSISDRTENAIYLLLDKEIPRFSLEPKER